MAQHLEVVEISSVTVARILVGSVVSEEVIQELRIELFSLIVKKHPCTLLLNFVNVEFLSSSALGMLVTLHNKVKAAGGKLTLCSIRPDIFEVFLLTNLNKLLDIFDGEEADAVLTFNE